MNLTLTRNQFREDGIFSRLTDENGNLVAVTLEHAYTQAGGGFSPKIPNGKFTCVRGMRTLQDVPEPFATFEITNVPGHTNLLFHMGNFNQDSEGCVLLGSKLMKTTLGVQWISNSRATFAKFMATQNVESFILSVVQ